MFVETILAPARVCVWPIFHAMSWPITRIAMMLLGMRMLFSNRAFAAPEAEFRMRFVPSRFTAYSSRSSCVRLGSLMSLPYFCLLS